MRKVLALLLSLVMTLTLLVPATWAEEKPAAGYQLPASLKGKTVILHTNDVHGAIDKYAKVAALKNECYDRGASAVVLLDAGDFSLRQPQQGRYRCGADECRGLRRRDAGQPRV